ncbi:MAG TPA: hypothetical protein VLC98_16700 [Phnomibacter sp.]|nr:hypothetical protein [Phnomibacter sp.]
MIEYISNLLPRIQAFSKSLDHQESFVEKTWVLLDEEGNRQQYIFMRDGRFLMSLNGKVQEGKWEYISTSRCLLIDRGTDKLMFNQAFLDEAVMILKIDGVNTIEWMLANANILPDLNIKDYLRSVERRNLNIITVRSQSGDVIDIEGAAQPGIFTGMKVWINDEPATDETIKLTDGSILVIKDGIIHSISYEQLYNSKIGKITVFAQFKNLVSLGDKVSGPTDLPEGKWITIQNNYQRIKIRNSIIYKSQDMFTYGTLFALIVLLIIAIVLIVTQG